MSTHDSKVRIVLSCISLHEKSIPDFNEALIELKLILQDYHEIQVSKYGISDNYPSYSMNRKIISDISVILNRLSCARNVEPIVKP